MVRRLVAHGAEVAGNQERARLPGQVEEFVGAPRGPRRVGESLEVETRRMMESGEWEGAKGKHFVAVFALMFREVYGLPAGELGSKAALDRAAGLATRTLTREFGGDVAEMAEFTHWLWKREGSREQWRKANHRSGGRLTIGIVFSASAITDWRIDGRRTGR